LANVMPMIGGDLRSATDEFQRRLISAALERHQDNWASAARELGVDRANLGRMAKRLGMKG
jgi:anaerobic nitric oxide reductase transcription regulator